MLLLLLVFCAILSADTRRPFAEFRSS